MSSATGVNFNIPKYDATGQPTGAAATQTRIFDADISTSSRDYYVKLFQRLAEIFELIRSGSAPNTAQLQEFINILTALNAWSSIKTIDSSTGKEIDLPSNTTVGPDKTPAYDLSKLVPGGKIPADLAGPVTSTMTKAMAVELERLLSILRVNGFDLTSPQANMNTLGNALVAIAGPNRDDSVHLFAAAIKKAYVNAATIRTIEDMKAGKGDIETIIMTDFINRMNDRIYGEMSLLKDAIDHNDQVLGFLNGLQDLMNQKDPTKFVINLYDLSSRGWGGGAYDTFEQQFNKPIDPKAYFPEGSKLSGMDPKDPEFKKLFLETITDPNNPQNTAAYNYSRDVLVKNIDDLIKAISTDKPQEISRLVTALTVIKNDLIGIAGANPLKQFISDIQIGKEGDYQRHINEAITASQSFNDTQREKLRKEMMIFEQFVSAAMKIISELNERKLKIASGIISR